MFYIQTQQDPHRRVFSAGCLSYPNFQPHSLCLTLSPLSHAYTPSLCRPPLALTRTHQSAALSKDGTGSFDLSLPALINVWIYSADLQGPGSHDTLLLRWNLVFLENQSQPLILFIAPIKMLFTQALGKENETNPSARTHSTSSAQPKVSKIPPLSQITGQHTPYLPNQRDFTKSA